MSYMNLEKQDIAVIGLGIVISVVSGLLSTGKSLQFISQVEIYTTFLNAPFFLVAAYSIYKFRSVWGGEIARYLMVAATGLAIQMLIWIPHILWHISGLPKKFAPSAIGFSGSFWLMLFHLAGPVSLVLTAYGFYNLYQAAE